MPPHEFPTKCVRCTPRPSRMSTMHRAQSSKVNGAVSFWLSPKPGGSTRITWCSVPKCSACAAHMSPVISRLGQNITESPLPLTCTRTVPSTVSINRDSATVERRLLKVEPAERVPQHFVVDLSVVAFFDIRRAFGCQHLQPQSAERRCGALADFLLVAAQPLPRGVAPAGVPAPQYICSPLVHVG